MRVSSYFIFRNYTDKDYDQWIEAARFCRLAYMDVTVLESIAAMTQADIMIAEESIIQNEFTQIAKRRQIWPAFGQDVTHKIIDKIFHLNHVGNQKLFRCFIL